MKAIGGFIELDRYERPMMHESAIALNCGRNALAYLIRSRGIKRICLPYFCCDSVLKVCDREGVDKRYYHINPDFRPVKELALQEDEWLYLVNFYGQLSRDDVEQYKKQYKRVIVDQANGYFEKPLPETDTIYTCRKWFGVPDGAFLYTDSKLNEELPEDVSFDHMRFLLGRFELGPEEFYNEYTSNNRRFADEPVKYMSKLTENLLRAIDYEKARERRAENFAFLSERLGKYNKLSLRPALFMYPLWVENGAEIRKNLQKNKIFVPTLWPSVFETASENDIEYQMAENILPLPVDQRYGIEEMAYLCDRVIEELEGRSKL